MQNSSILLKIYNVINMRPWKKREIREVEQPHIEVPTDACAIANEGIGLLQKLLNLK